ncbi:MULTISPECIES: flavin reductase family protein [Streptomyces]|uniref:flavin reductase family protein n=1 Tax=Streptomyces TaxID=1883 RepID=UPI00017EADCB|nr:MULTISPECIES: flavin reductase family protein [Streptomyces]AKL71167.1 flavin reductase [Streptomyces sp. Mg1]EDX25063.1 monooxygenase [Streptomyces sp. Mg1]MBP0932588.1 flavin reductase family protein [Streptomyces sp. KCTC 0041BP]OKI38075.1 flavin reductase [Streptomyces sp. CB03578]WBY24865.1 flavin reductase family protein [Streptomyces goshikiensis]
MSTLTAAPPRDLATGDPARLRRAFGAFATGVTVVTVGGEAPRGMTANSFTSVSLDPALVLLCVGKEAVMHRTLAEADTFSVSVLGAGQEAVARHFADRSRPAGARQFDAVDWLPGSATDAPLIAGAAAHFECAKWRAYDGGDHTVYLGQVLSLDELPDREPLVFHRGRFRRLDAPAQGGAA